MIKPLQAFRFIAIVAVFLTHQSGIRKANEAFFDRYLGFGYCGVTFFILLSGFVMGMNYGGKYAGNQGYSIRSMIVFLNKRLSRVYPLHLVTLLVSVPLYFDNIVEAPVKSAVNFLLNVALLQSFIPISSVFFSYNGVAWYLSASVLFYLATPPLLSLFGKLKSKTNMIVTGILLYSALTAFVFMFKDDKHSYWLLYISPFYRLGDYIIGMLCGLAHAKGISDENRRTNMSVGMLTVIEMLAVLGFVTVYLNSFRMHVSYTYDVYFIPSMIALLVAFSPARGWVSRILGNQAFLYLGKISFEFYLIHQLVMFYAWRIVKIKPAAMESAIYFVVAISLAMLANFALAPDNIRRAYSYMRFLAGRVKKYALSRRA